MPPRTARLLLLFLPLLGACGGKPERTGASALPSPASPATATATAPAPAVSTEPRTAPAPPPSPGVRSITDRTGTGHVTLTGSYTVDAEAKVSCSLLEDALEVSWSVPGQPRLILHVPKLAGSGTYKGDVRVLVSDSSESGFRPSSGTASAEIRIGPGPATVAAPRAPQKTAAGSFRTTYAGEAGKGSVAGRFSDCVYEESSETP